MAVSEIPTAADGSIIDYRWASSGIAVEPSSGRKDTGWQPSDVVTEGERNWLDNTSTTFANGTLRRVVRADQGFYTNWFAGGGAWRNGAAPLQGFLGVGASTTRVANLWLDPNDEGAVFVQVRVSSGAPHVFVASRTTYVFVPDDENIAGDADLTYLDVPLNDNPPATPAGTVLVWRVDTDASSITAATQRLPTSPTMGMVNIMQGFVQTLTVGGNSTFGENASNTATFIASAAFNSPATFRSNVNLGDAAADVITVDGTASFSQPVTMPTLASNMNFGGNTISGTGTVSATTLTGSSLVFNSVGFPTTANATLAYNGDSLFIGDGTSARRVHSPVEIYISGVPAVTQANVIIPGASIARTIEPTDDVEIIVEAAQTASLAGSDVSLRLDATNGVDTVSILNLGDPDQGLSVPPTTTGAGDRVPNRIRVRWRPTNDVPAPVNNAWTIRARHGISGPGGTAVTTTNIKLELSFV